MVLRTDIGFSGRDNDRLITDLQAALRSLGEAPFLEGRRIRSVSLAAGSTSVPHGLRRQPQGWILLDSLAASGSAISRTGWDTTTITFNATVAAVVDLWVF